MEALRAGDAGLAAERAEALAGDATAGLQADIMKDLQRRIED